MLIHWAVKPLLHIYEVAPAAAHNCVDPPRQIVVFPVITHVGDGIFDTVLLQMLLHPAELVTVRVYVPAKLILMHLVVAPVLHKYVAELAIEHNRIVEPEHIVCCPIIEHTGIALTVTINVAEVPPQFPVVVTE